MRLWSISPKYLDSKGLVACWREGLLAQSVLLKGKYTLGKRTMRNTPYWNHPQLDRFKPMPDKLMCLSVFLLGIYFESIKRGYNFNLKKIDRYDFAQTLNNSEYLKINVTKGQLEYEFNHLQKKLWARDMKQRQKNCGLRWDDFEGFVDKGIEPHPLFKVIEGEVESWEKITKEN